MIAAKRDRTQERSGVRRATDRDYYEWFALLDRWGALGRPFREIAERLEVEHDVSSWWAQKLIVEYEQAQGLRPPGVRLGGTFTRRRQTVGVPVERLYDAFVDPEERERTSRPRRSARFDWADDGTRVSVTFGGHGRCQEPARSGARATAHPEAVQKTRAF